MPVVTLTQIPITHQLGSFLVRGALGENWALKADARIKSDENDIGVGPVVFEGLPKLADGTLYKSGSPRDGLFVFFDLSDCTFALAEMLDPVDLQDTLSDYLTNHGGDIAAMKANRPSA